MMKRLIILAAMLAILLAAAVPALAQEEGATQGEATDAPPAPSPSDKATLSFELTVKGAPPEGTTFLGFIPAEGGISAPLTDPDGDGVFTGSVTLDRFGPGPRPVPPDTEPVSLPIQIVQNTGGDIEVIRDFGTVPLNGDRTFRARVNFKKDRGDTTTPEDTTPDTTTPDPGTGDPSDNGGSVGDGSGSSGSSNNGGDPSGGSSGNGSSGAVGSGSGGSDNGDPVSGSDNGGDPAGGSSGSGGSGKAGGRSPSGPGGIKALPKTGGATLTTLGVGVLLIGGGLLLRKVLK